jgi:DNA transformation protein
VPDREATRAAVDRVLAALEPLPVRARAMFGGFGLYLEERFFGLVNDGMVYFLTDDASRPAYIARGSVAFQPANRPAGPRTVPRNFQVPPEVLADAEELRAWAQRAAQAPATSAR